jgi:glutaredoxin 3
MARRSPAPLARLVADEKEQAPVATTPKILMYGADWCGYCARARRLLDSKGAAYEEIDVDLVPGARQEMQARSGRGTIPQIFINGQHIGGADDLQALEAEGGLDPLLK